MKQTKNNLFIGILLSIGFSPLFAQQAVTASGGNATGSGGQAAYSVGQVAYTTNSNSIATISQGVQQAYEIFSIGINEKKQSVSASLFPSPTQEGITLEVKQLANEQLTYSVFDMQGKLLLTDKVRADETNISLKEFTPGIYFIKINNSENKKTQSFKIIKH
jgi:hypothetical protein